MIPLAKLPEYLKKTGYRCPKDSRSGPLQYAFDTDTPSFDLFASQSGVMENFNTFMTGVRGGRQSWVDWFPIEKQLLDDAADDEGAACMVDVGGGHGHNVIEVRDRFPSVPGRFIVQDLPSVIEEVGDSDARIETMGMNMFNPQPVKGMSHRLSFFPTSSILCQPGTKMRRELWKPVFPGPCGLRHSLWRDMARQYNEGC